MYEGFFGFREPPFRLVPDPAYLYLSQSHEEALAHLAFAAARGEGFMTITGEVGTGKTTLCRVFLENLDEGTEAALIFNPKLTATQLLKTICDEFAVSADDDPKDLIDALNAFLLQQASQGKNVILIVDEAQNLSGDVLEQLRLLSNLETTTRKLIQIILVGQPELETLLASHELRQLSQRITLSCRLAPLSADQTREYVRHRLRIAGAAPDVAFSSSALKAVQAYSRGIPRLINIACDRALLTAFVRDRRTVSGAVARAAMRELPRHAARGAGRRIRLAAVCLAAALCAALAAVHFRGNVNGLSVQEPVPPAVERPAAAAAAAPASGGPSSPTAEAGLDRLLAGLDPAASGLSAVDRVLARWGVILPAAPETAPAAVEGRLEFLAARHGLKVQPITGDIDRLRRLNLPAVISFEAPDGRCCSYLALVATDAQQAQLVAGGAAEPVAVAWAQVASRWAGSAYVVWKDLLEPVGHVTPAAPRDAIRRLQELLHDAGAAGLAPTGVYDAATRRAVVALQQRHGLEPDGVVGPLTKIALLEEQRREPVPRLSRAGVIGGPPGAGRLTEVNDP